MNQHAMPNTDPLAQLRDIHTPPPIDSWPPAPGWWVLAAMAVIGIALLFIWAIRRWRANRYRREALGELNGLYEEYRQGLAPADWLTRFEALIKRVALTRYPREQVASLTGEAWVAFLDRTMGSREFSMGPGQALIDSHYRPGPDVDVEALHELGLAWIKKHGETEFNMGPVDGKPSMQEAA